jgi:hypothetical protein
MSGRVYLRGRVWWISYYRDGKEQRQSSGSTDQREAEKLLQLRQDGMAAERLGLQKFQGPKVERVTVGELLDAGRGQN